MLIDANLLIYAYVEELPQLREAHAWLDAHLNTMPRVGLPWPALLAFVRLVSHPRVFERPVSVATAWHQVEQWLGVPAVWVPGPTARHALILGPLVREATPRANLVPDAHLAALAIEHGLTLYSTDGDFARFPRLRWLNPLATQA
jgi:toxin-antitoxin system PIN domain toxin